MDAIGRFASTVLCVSSHATNASASRVVVSGVSVLRHAIAFARWLLKEEYPADVTAYLVEGRRFEVGEGLSPQVDAAVDRLVDILLDGLSPAEAPA